MHDFLRLPLRGEGSNDSITLCMNLAIWKYWIIPVTILFVFDELFVLPMRRYSDAAVVVLCLKLGMLNNNWRL